MEKKWGGVGGTLELISGGMEVDFVVVFDLRPGNTKNVSLSVLSLHHPPSSGGWNGCARRMPN